MCFSGPQESAVLSLMQETKCYFCFTFFPIKSFWRNVWGVTANISISRSITGGSHSDVLFGKCQNFADVTETISSHSILPYEMAHLFTFISLYYVFKEQSHYCVISQHFIVHSKNRFTFYLVSKNRYVFRFVLGEWIHLLSIFSSLYFALEEQIHLLFTASSLYFALKNRYTSCLLSHHFILHWKNRYTFCLLSHHFILQSKNRYTFCLFSHHFSMQLKNWYTFCLLSHHFSMQSKNRYIFHLLSQHLHSKDRCSVLTFHNLKNYLAWNETPNIFMSNLFALSTRSHIHMLYLPM